MTGELAVRRQCLIPMAHSFQAQSQTILEGIAKVGDCSLAERAAQNQSQLISSAAKKSVHVVHLAPRSADLFRLGVVILPVGSKWTGFDRSRFVRRGSVWFAQAR